MTFYLIGLGLEKNSIGADALEKLKVCDEVYLENYTVNFPYGLEELESSLNVKIKKLNRKEVEDESILENANDKNIALLVYGDSLSATTHMQLIIECKKRNIPYEIFHNASILIAIANTGLQPYKFGKTTSMPNWKEHTNKPTSYMNVVKENDSINAHTLILTDIGLDFQNSLEQLEESAIAENLELEKIIVISNAGTKSQKIVYGNLQEIKSENIEYPFCLIIPKELHFIEEEALNVLKNN